MWFLLFLLGCKSTPQAESSLPAVPVEEGGFRAQVKVIRKVSDLRAGETAKILPSIDKDGRVFIEPFQKVNAFYGEDLVTRADKKTYVVTLLDHHWDSPVEPSQPYRPIYPLVRRPAK